MSTSSADTPPAGRRPRCVPLGAPVPHTRCALRRRRSRSARATRRCKTHSMRRVMSSEPSVLRWSSDSSVGAPKWSCADTTTTPCSNGTSAAVLTGPVDRGRPRGRVLREPEPCGPPGPRTCGPQHPERTGPALPGTGRAGIRRLGDGHLSSRHAPKAYSSPPDPVGVRLDRPPGCRCARSPARRRW